MINNSYKILENKSNNNCNIISSESFSGNSGDNLSSSGNDEGQRFPEQVTKVQAWWLWCKYWWRCSEFFGLLLFTLVILRSVLEIVEMLFKVMIHKNGN